MTLLGNVNEAPGHGGGGAAPRLLFVAALLVFAGAALFALRRGSAPSPADHAAAFLVRTRAGTADEGGPGAAAEPGSVETAGPVFADVARSSGLLFDHDSGARGEKRLPEIIGPGGAFLDYDGDGRLDVFLVGGGEPGGPGPGQACRLFRNAGGAFEDVTEAARLDVAGPGYGVACADFDEDGDVDLYVTRLGPNALLVNDGRGGFDERGAAAGVAHGGFGTSCTFFDYDGDGWLDLYVTNYVDWTPEIESPCYIDQGLRDYCMPLFYEKPSRDVLYRNLGDGTFEDVSESSGIAADTGNGLGVIACDYDDDGRPDLYVANDQTPGMLWRNLGDGKFENEAFLAGCAYDGNGIAIAGMGVACEDFDGDGRFDLLVTNIRSQSHLFLENRGTAFSDRSATRGLGAWSDPATAFGIAVFDQDLDGGLDAYVANGDVNLDLSSEAELPYAQRNHFVRITGGAFVDASRAGGCEEYLVSRSVATGDFDDDGDLDLLLTNNGGPVQLLRNEGGPGAWLTLEVRERARGAEAGKAPLGRHSIGARVRVEVGDRAWTREVRPQQGYLASNDPRVHFGLGAATAVDRLVVLWPDGEREEFLDVEARRHLALWRGEPLREVEGRTSSSVR